MILETRSGRAKRCLSAHALATKLAIVYDIALLSLGEILVADVDIGISVNLDVETMSSRRFA